MKIIIIADDLTGAADTGVQFLGMTGHSMKMAGLDHTASGSPSGGLSIHTQTRNGSESAAKAAMDRAADIIRHLKKPEIIYKKVDSCLRGHLGLELGALVRNMRFKGALVAPAYPTFGRVTKEGLHYVGDKLVSESEVAHDPIRPVTDPSLANIIGRNNDCEVKNLPLSVVERGVEAVAGAVGEMLSQSAPVLIAADAVTDKDLDVLAEAGLQFKDSLIFTGSAGLAGGLSRVTAGEHPPKPEPIHPRGPIIYFGGSMSQNLKNQVGALVAAGHAELSTLNIHKLIESGGDMPLLSWPAESNKGLALLLSQDEGAPAGEEFSHRLITAFGIFAASLVRALKPGAIFMSGGDTAQATLEKLALNELWLRRELMPGVVYMEAEGMGIITKAGSFGAPDILVNLHKSLQ